MLVGFVSSQLTRDRNLDGAGAALRFVLERRAARVDSVCHGAAQRQLKGRKWLLLQIKEKEINLPGGFGKERQRKNGGSLSAHLTTAQGSNQALLCSLPTGCRAAQS